MKLKLDSKGLQIDKAQQTTIMVLCIAVAVSVFSLVSSKRLWSQAAYQRHVVSAKRQAAQALQTDVNAAAQLTNNYNNVFNNSSISLNVIGGKNRSGQPPDGTNSQIVLDGLPTTYDFPALISSISRVLNDNGIINPGISGSDQSASISSLPSSNPSPVPIQLSISGTGNILSIKHLIRDLEHSIRPIDVTNIELRGSNAVMSVSLNIKTYFQPAKTLSIGTKTVR